MKAVILAGGLGTRLSEETSVKPKPMVDIGGRPILWHIMKLYSEHGINDFVVCVGYKGYMIKSYFANYFMHNSDITIDFANNHTEIHQNHAEPWRVTLVDTGERTMTGGRLKRIEKYLGEDDFCMTYGDGVSNVNVSALVKFHREQGTLATLTAVQPPGRFGAVDMEQAKIRAFQEKPVGDGGWVNGGFFVLSPKVLEFIDGDTTLWEQAPMERLAAQGQFSAYKHHGFWHPMDTVRDKIALDEMWESGKAPWKIWQ